MSMMAIKMRSDVRYRIHEVVEKSSDRAHEEIEKAADLT